MNFIKTGWNSNEYTLLINYLFEIRDVKYRDFNSRIGVFGNIIGVRTLLLRNIAKEISMGDYRGFLDMASNTYYEEIILYGFVVCNISDLDESIGYLDIYKEKIDNWASCDLFCSGYKIVKNNKEYFWKYINNNIGSDNLWIRRLCFVLILNYFVDDRYLNDIFNLCDKYNVNDYYVQMAVAWLISFCYVKYKRDTYSYILNNKLDNFTHNKAIQKIRESYRVDFYDKEKLDKLKRK